MARPGGAASARFVNDRQGQVRIGEEGQQWNGENRTGVHRKGSIASAGTASDRSGGDWRGSTGLAWKGDARRALLGRGMDWQQRHVEDGKCEQWRGKACLVPIVTEHSNTYAHVPNRTEGSP